MLFTMPGVSWTLLFTAKPAFFLAYQQMLPRLVLGAGIVLSLLLFRIGWTEAHRRVAAERAAALRSEMAERERAARELQEALASEKELNRLKSSFVATVSREFRTPLAVIQISTDLLERHHERLEPAQRVEQLQTIANAVRRMSGLMEQVLLLSRVEGGNIEFKPAPLDLAALIRRVCDEVTTATQSRCPIEVKTVDLANARADEGLLRIVFGNLVNNAVKYSEAGSAVSVAAERAGNDFVVTVRDRGIGIPAAEMKHLFTPFHRAQNAVNIQGTGLGLAIVKRCVTLHGGSVRCEGEAGKGTTFTVRLPVFAGEKTS
jgi:signal transduction histidine kinase